MEHIMTESKISQHGVNDPVRGVDVKYRNKDKDAAWARAMGGRRSRQAFGRSNRRIPARGAPPHAHATAEQAHRAEPFRI